MTQFWKATSERLADWLRNFGRIARERINEYANKRRSEYLSGALVTLKESNNIELVICAAIFISKTRFKDLYLENQVEEALLIACQRHGEILVLELSTIMNQKTSDVYGMFSKLLKVAYQSNTQKALKFIDSSIEYLNTHPNYAPSIFYAFKIIVLNFIYSSQYENAKEILFGIYRRDLLLKATSECSKSVSNLLDFILKYCVAKHYQASTQDSITLLDVLQVIKCMSCKPSEIFFNKLLDMIAKGSHNMKNSESILEIMIHSKVKASLITFNTLLDIYISQKNMKMAWYLFDSLVKNQDPKPDAYTYCTMIGGLRRVHPVDLDTIESIFEMYCADTTPDMIVSNCMVDVYVICGREDKVKDLLETLKTKYGCLPDHATFNTMIKGCSMTRDLNKAERYFAELRNRGLKPTKVTFNSLMDICVKTRQLPRALSYLKEMSQEGLEPDMFSYSIVLNGIKSSSSEGMYRQCLTNLMMLLTSHSFAVDEVFFNTIIDVACKFGDLEKVEEVYQVMKQRKVNPSSITFGILIKTYGKARMGCRVMEVFQDMSNTHNIQPNEVTYGSLIEALINSDCLQEAESVFNQLPSRKIKVNSVILSTMIKGYSKRGCHDKAIDLFENYRASGNMRLNLICYNSVIDASVNYRDMRLAEEYFDEMYYYNIMPDLITYSIMIKGHSFNKNPSQAVHLLNAMIKEGITPDLRIFNNLLELCSSFKDCNKGIKVFSLMNRSGCHPNLISFGIMVKIYGFSREVEKAFSLLKYMDSLGIIPSVIFFTNLMHISIANKKPDSAVQAFNLMEQYGLAPDQFCANKLMEGLVKTCKNQSTVDEIKSRLLQYELKASKDHSGKATYHNYKIDAQIDQENRNDGNAGFAKNHNNCFKVEEELVNVSSSKLQFVSLDNRQPVEHTTHAKPELKEDKHRQFGNVIKNRQPQKALSKTVKTNMIR